MSLFSTLRSGASGMGVAGTGLAVIGDNIANMGTVGFKTSRANFADMMPDVTSGLSGRNMLGSGARLSSISTNFHQGMMEGTSSALDVGINGKGFFAVSDGNTEYYTRDGSFHLDENNFLVNGSGMRVQGYTANDPVSRFQFGVLTKPLGDIQLDLTPMAQRETDNITLEMQLSAQADFATTPVSTALAAGLDGTAASGGATLQELSADADFATSVTVYDSLGVPHDASVFFERTGANTWSWVAATDGGAVQGATAADEGFALSMASGTLTFDSSGNLDPATPPTQTAGTTAFTWPGAAAFSFDLNLGVDTTGAAVDGEIRMVDSASYVSGVSQDGYTVGNVSSINTDDEGVISAVYSNGKELVLGQLGTAMFKAEAGLERAGGNMFRATLASGDAAIGEANVGGRGKMQGYALERSNVELEDEFVGMIQAQRAYQANGSTIRTANEGLQQLIRLV
jgi:flagellar hook protein FlgE